MALLDDMLNDGIQPDVVVYNSIFSVLSASDDFKCVKFIDVLLQHMAGVSLAGERVDQRPRFWLDHVNRSFVPVMVEPRVDSSGTVFQT